MRHAALEFPDVMSKGGFDVVIGNPPERPKFGGESHNKSGDFLQREDLATINLAEAAATVPTSFLGLPA
jgi:hypothetical protein